MTNTAEFARALAIIADAVVVDLENAGIPADTTKDVALVYRQLALEESM